MPLPQVQKIACTNEAIFTMNFSVAYIEDDGSTGYTDNSGNYPNWSLVNSATPPLTVTIDLANHEIEEGTIIWPYVQAIAGTGVNGGNKFAYAPNGLTATYEVKGTTFNYSVKLRRAPCQPPNFPAHIAVDAVVYQNWALQITAADMVWQAIAKNEQDVVDLANWAQQNGYKLRPSGQNHNWSPIVVPNGTEPCAKVLLVDVTNLKGQRSLQIQNGYPTATFGTGTTVEEATSYLESLDNQGMGAAPGYTFQNMTAPGKLTLGGVMAIGGHGTGVSWKVKEPNLNGCMSNLIVSFKAVVTDPENSHPNLDSPYTLKEFHRDHVDASTFLVHLGRAFLTSLTLRVIPNYYLQVKNWYPTADVFFQAPSSSLSPEALATMLDNYGRLEVIWFPFTDEPWIKTWELKTEKLNPWVDSPYNYPWANNISLVLNDTIKTGLFKVPSTTRLFGSQQLGITKSKAPASQVMNGTARSLLLYVKDSTLRVTACGYAILINRSQVQETVNQFYQWYKTKLASYAEIGKYPVNGPVEIRFTSIDRVDDLGVPNAVPPAISASHSFSQELDTVFWLDVLTLPGTPDSNEFFVELEQWMKLQWGQPAKNNLRPEWSKGWAYTEANGAWSNQDILTQDIPNHYNQPAGIKTFDLTQSTLKKYDKFNIYTNLFLDNLLPG